jgi:hypothetical protein
MNIATIWWCERCHASGLEDFTGLSVYDALYRLEAAHNVHVLAIAQACAYSSAKVRVHEHVVPRATARHAVGLSESHGGD